MSDRRFAEVIVAGLGAFGAATLCALSRRGVRAIGIDRYHPPHTSGSSHGESRITRLAVGEGAAYAPFVRRSHVLWRELEQETGRRLMLQTGGLVISPAAGGAVHHGKTSFVRETIAVAEAFGIAHEVLNADAIAARFPQLGLRGDELGYYEPEAGMLFPEACIEAELEVAARAGATIRTGETVREVQEAAEAVTVVTDAASYSAGAVVMATGAWLAGMAGGAVARHARVLRQTFHWFAPDDPELYAPGRFPVFIWIHGARERDSFYGFPMPPGSAGVKVGTEQYTETADPDSVERQVAPEESAAMHEAHVASRLRGVTARPTRASACLYTVTSDRNFIVDRAPGRARVHLISACSGHGFKHSAAIGEAVAQRLTGEASLPLEPFSLARFAR